MTRQLANTRPNKTDAGNGSKAICRVSNVHCARRRLIRNVRPTQHRHLPTPDAKSDTRCLTFYSVCLLSFLSSLRCTSHEVFHLQKAPFDPGSLAAIIRSLPLSQDEQRRMRMRSAGHAVEVLQGSRQPIGRSAIFNPTLSHCAVCLASPAAGRWHSHPLVSSFSLSTSEGFRLGRCRDVARPWHYGWHCLSSRVLAT